MIFDGEKWERRRHRQQVGVQAGSMNDIIMIEWMKRVAVGVGVTCWLNAPNGSNGTRRIDPLIGVGVR